LATTRTKRIKASPLQSKKRIAVLGHSSNVFSNDRKETSMESIKKAMSNVLFFVVAYVIFMLPTYLLPYLGSNSSVAQGAAMAAGSSALQIPFILHLISLLILCYLEKLRGDSIGKSWLIAFPVIALLFDLVPFLSAIPLIPTIMHMLAIVFGVIGSKKVQE
jgi:hypothetical protein